MWARDDRSGGEGGKEYRGMESKTTCGGRKWKGTKMERDTDGEEWKTAQEEVKEGQMKVDR